jgi:hypothetical protein
MPGERNNWSWEKEKKGGRKITDLFPVVCELEMEVYGWYFADAKLAGERHRDAWHVRVLRFGDPSLLVRWNTTLMWTMSKEKLMGTSVPVRSIRERVLFKLRMDKCTILFKSASFISLLKLFQFPIHGHTSILSKPVSQRDSYSSQQAIWLWHSSFRAN